MKKSNVILITAFVVLAISIWSYYFSVLSGLSGEMRRKVVLSGVMVSKSQMFEEVKGVMFSGKFDVTLIPDKYNKIEIEADKNIMPLIYAQRMGEGKVDVRLNNYFYNRGDKKVKVRFHFHKMLYLFAVGSDVRSDSVIRQNYLSIDGLNSRIELNIIANEVNMTEADDTKFIISGKTSVANINLQSNAELDAGNLIIDDCRLSSKNNSTAKLNVTKSLSKHIMENSKYTLTNNNIKINENRED